jgi:hypothetical protein
MALVHERKFSAQLTMTSYDMVREIRSVSIDCNLRSLKRRPPLHSAQGTSKQLETDAGSKNGAVKTLALHL